MVHFSIPSPGKRVDRKKNCGMAKTQKTHFMLFTCILSNNYMFYTSKNKNG
jgi:hypothetical protein